MQETMFGTYAHCTAQAYQAARSGTGPSRLKPLYPSANEYYHLNADARYKTNKGNKSHLTLGDERDWRMTSNNMEMIKPASEPQPRHEPLIDNFESMSVEEKDVVYTTALRRAGATGVRELEKSIRMKISQKTSGGPFALRKAFKYFDRDGSGSIDPDEFYAAMDFFGLQFTADQVLGLFGTYDDDRSGSLEYYEFVEKLLDEGMGAAKADMKHFLADFSPPMANSGHGMSLKESKRASMSTVQKLFQQFDVNHSGQIDSRELRFFLEKLGLMASTDVVSQVMEQLDGNANGEISWEEFWAWWQRKYAESRSPSPSSPAGQNQPGQPVLDQNHMEVEEEIGNRPAAQHASRGVTPSEQVQQLRRMGRPSAPSRQNEGSLDFPERPLPSRGSLFSRGSSLGNFSVGPKWCDAPDGETQQRSSMPRRGFRSRTPTANAGPRISFAAPPSASSLGFVRPGLGPNIDANVQTAGMLNLSERMHASGRVHTGFRIGGAGPGENPFQGLVVPPRRK